MVHAQKPGNGTGTHSPRHTSSGVQPASPGLASGRWTLPGFGDDDRQDGDSERKPTRKSSGYQRETVIEAAMKSAARSVATSVGRGLVRGILGSLRR